MDLQVLRHPHIETTTRCNLRCPGCWAEKGNPNARRDMSLEDFETIVSRLGPFDGASLHNGGEPTLNPALPEMVALLARSGQAKTIRIVSNGLARPLSCYERLFEAGLNALEISVDTFSPELAFRIRKGTDVEELKRKLRDLRTIFPGLVTRTTVSRLNLGEVLETFKLLLSLGISKLCVQPFESRTPDENVLSLRERLDFAATLEQFSKESGIPVDRQFFTPSDKTSCCVPFVAPNITVDGRMTPCCNLPFPSDCDYGSLLEAASLREVWESPAALKFREESRRGFPKLCSTCTVKKRLDMAELLAGRKVLGD